SRMARLFTKKESSSSGTTPVAEPASGPPSKETLKERIARQAKQAGGGVYSTGESLIGLGEEMAKSKLASQLASKKAAYEKKQAEQRQADEAAAAAAAKTPKKKQTLDEFLAATEGGANSKLAESEDPIDEGAPEEKLQSS
ncbi:PH domain-containing protein, partial [Durusdinium trenchii]